MYKDNNFSAAVQLLEHLVHSEQHSTTPTYFELLSMRSNSFLQLGKYDEALRDAEVLIELNPNVSAGYYRKAMVFYEAVDFDRAMMVIQAGLDIDPSDRQLNELVDDIKKNSIRQQLKTVMDAARDAFAQRRYTLAADQFSKAIERNPSNFIYYVYRSLCLLAAGNIRAAHEDIWRAVEMEPSWAREQPVTKQGVMKKVGRVNPMKKKRWFVLKYNYLFYFPFATTRDPPPSGVIIVHEYVPKYTRDDKYIELQDFKGRVFKLETESASEGQHWKELLTAVPSVTPLPEDPNETRIQWQPKAIAHGVAAILKNRIVGRLRPAPIILQRIRKSGDLFKKGVFNAAWKRRWFVILQDDHYLYWFDSQPERLDGPATPHKRVDLLNCTCRTVDATEFKEADAYEESPGPVFQVEAEGELFILSHDKRLVGEAESWLSLIRSLSLMYREDQRRVPRPLSLVPVEPAPPPPTQPAVVAIEEAEEGSAADDQRDRQYQQHAEEHLHHGDDRGHRYEQYSGGGDAWDPDAPRHRPQPVQHGHKITKDQMSYSEARFFSKFGLDSSSDLAVPQQSLNSNERDWEIEGERQPLRRHASSTRRYDDEDSYDDDDDEEEGCCGCTVA